LKEKTQEEYLFLIHKKYETKIFFEKIILKKAQDIWFSLTIEKYGINIYN